MSEQVKRTVLQLTQQEFGDWLELHGRRLYKDFYAQLRTDLDETLRRQDARWQSLNARVAELTSAVHALAGEPADGADGAHRANGVGKRQDDDLRCVRQALEGLTAAVATVQHELAAQRTVHRDPFSVFAALLRDLPTAGLRAGHAIWHPKLVDTYLRDTWQLNDPERRRYKTVWRDAHLIAVERDSFTRKFTVERGVVAYRFAVPAAMFDLFHVSLGFAGKPSSAGYSAAEHESGREDEDHAGAAQFIARQAAA